MVDLEDVLDGCRNLALSTHLEQVMSHLVHHGVIGNHGVMVGGHGRCEGAMMKASRTVVAELFIGLMVCFDTYGLRGPS